MTLLIKIFSLCFALILPCLSPKLAHANSPSLEFNPSSVEAGLLGSFTVSVLVDTAGFATGGVGAIIRFDPFMVSATAIETGKIFADYPLTSINNQLGKITISGISASADHLYSGKGEFAKITFKTNQLGFSDVSFDYQPGSTSDSNIAVTFGNGDILSAVNTLKIKTLPATITPRTDENPLLSFFSRLSYTKLKEAIDIRLATLNLPFISSKYASAREGRTVSKNLDPLNPIVAQAPITDPSNTQTIASTTQILNIGKTPTILPYLLIGLGLSLTIIVLYLKYRTEQTNY